VNTVCYNYSGVFKTTLLCEELILAIPSLIVGEGGFRSALFSLGAINPTTENPEGGVEIIVSDNIPEESIRLVVMAHNPANLSVNDRTINERKKRKDNIDTNLYDLVGKSFNSLNSNDKLRLLMVILMNFGILDSNFIIRPQSSWDL
jgi:hypothetical protein